MPPGQEPRRAAGETPGSPSWIAPVKPVIPDHELFDRIGGGSYGDVWLARSVVGTWRAVKVVFRDRFLDARPYEREFNGIQKFEPLSRSNEGFVDILQIGRNDAEGYFYYVMELADDAGGLSAAGISSVSSESPHSPSATGEIPGTRVTRPSDAISPESYVPKTLAKVLLQRGRLPVAECLELGITLNLALARLHAAGLIHRDIKPSNLIFVGGVPKLADIGLVIEFAEARSYVGTEGFIPPEGPNSPQADLYSLGKVLYEAGMGKDRKEFPEPPTQIGEAPDSAELLEFNAILLKACAANVKDRYQSAEEMNADLALLQSGGSVRRQRTLTRRLRSVQRAGALATALAVLVAGAWFYQARQTRIVRELAEQNRRVAEEKTVLASDNRDRVLQLHTANGIRLMNEGDQASAMRWFAQAMLEATNDLARVESHRFRLANLLAHQPKPIALIPLRRAGDEWTPRVGSSKVGVSENGQRVVNDSPDGIEVWDLMSLPPRRLAHLPNLGNQNHELALSPDGRRIVVHEPTRPAQLWTISDDGMTNAIQLGTNASDHYFTFSPDSSYCICLDDEALRRYDFNGRLAYAVRELPDDREATMISRSGGWLCGWERPLGKAWFVDTRTGRRTHEFKVGSVWKRIIPCDDGETFYAFSPDEAQWIWNGIGRYRVGLFHAADGTPIGRPLVHDNVILVDETDPSGIALATGGVDETARVWNLRTGDPLSPPLRHTSRVVAIALNHDASRIATGDAEGNVRLWEVRSGELLIPALPHAKGWANTIRFVRGDSALLTVGGDEFIRIWDLAIPGLQGKQLMAGPGLTEMKLSPDGELLAANAMHDLYLWETRDWKPVASIPTASGQAPTSVDFGLNSEFVAFTAKDSAPRVFNARSGQPAGPELGPPTNPVVSVAFSPNGAMLAAAGQDGLVRFWNWREGVETGARLNHTQAVTRLVFSPRGDLLFSAVLARGPFFFRGQIWDVGSRKPVGQAFPVRGGNEVQFCFRFNGDGSRWAYSGTDFLLHVDDAIRGQVAHFPIDRSWGRVEDVAFSGDGRFLAVASAGRRTYLYDLSNGKEVFPAVPQSDYVYGVQFTRDNHALAVWSGRQAALIDSRTGELLHPPLQGPRVRAWAVDPRDRFLAVGSATGDIRIQGFTDALPEISQLLDMVRLTTGRDVDAGGIGQVLSSDRLVEVLERLRKLLPQWFQPLPETLARWHENEILERPSVSQLSGTLYHIDQLNRLRPGDAELSRRKDSFLALQVPVRDPALPARLLDLSPYFTESFETMGKEEFAKLPRGMQRLGETDFDLRGLIVLRAGPPPPRATVVGDRISYIPVRQRCQRLQFLQAAQGKGVTAGFVALRFVIHYADGTQVTQTMIFGRDIWDWLSPSSEPPKVTDAIVAWADQGQTASRAGSIIRLYKSTWQNPRPDLEITHLEIEAGDTPANPFVVAISAE